MTFKQALALLKQAEKRAQKIMPRLNAAHIQWDNAHEVITQKYLKEWTEHCREQGLAIGYGFHDTLC